MIRAIAYMIISLLVITVLRSVMSLITGALSGEAQQGSSRASAGGSQKQRAPGARPPASESLKKDPVCGTFVAPSTALHLDQDGKTHYFCSADCREKFLPAKQT